MTSTKNSITLGKFNDGWLDKNGWLHINNNEIIMYQYAKTSWNPKTKNDYVQHGYDYTGLKTPLIINSWHLVENSGVRVEVLCPDCGKKYSKPFRHIIENEHTFCFKCVHKMRRTDITGEVFNRLTALQLHFIDKTYAPHWWCQCECDNIVSVRFSALINETIKSCGCYCIDKLKSQVGEKNPNWKGGKIDYYGPNWQNQREKARFRDNYCCQRCGLPEANNGRELDVHHITPFRSFMYVPNENDYYLEANDLSNLVSLCQKNGCHRIVETDYNRLFDYYTN